MIIDPIDGTEEFSPGAASPPSGTLMGIESNGEIVAAMVSAPGLHSRWWAYRGEGAYRDGTRLHRFERDQPGQSNGFYTGTGPSKNAHDQAKIRALLDAARNSRSFGGFWQHMLVAEGAIEVALDWTSKPWDLAPLGIMVEEAGGRSTNVHGGANDLYRATGQHKWENSRRSFGDFGSEASDVANQLSQGIALQFGRFQIADIL